MLRSTDRIVTTHTGSLPRPADLIEMIRAREQGNGGDEAAFQARVRDDPLDPAGSMGDPHSNGWWTV